MRVAADAFDVAAPVEIRRRLPSPIRIITARCSKNVHPPRDAGPHPTRDAYGIIAPWAFGDVGDAIPDRDHRLESGTVVTIGRPAMSSWMRRWLDDDVPCPPR